MQQLLLLRLLLVVILVIVPSILHSQGHVVPFPVPSSTRIAWDQSDHDNVTGWNIVFDGIRQDVGKIVADSSTNGTSNTFSLPLPVTTLGNHVIVIEAYNANGTTPSAEFQFVILAIPASPRNIRILTR